MRSKLINKPCFSNGTEFCSWISFNCEQCVKAVWFNEKTNRYPQYRCVVQGQIEAQIGIGSQVSERTWNIAQLAQCPNKKEIRHRYPRNKQVSKGLFEIINEENGN